MKEINYKRLSYEYNQHHERYKKFVNSLEHKLICQDCGGYGGEIDVIDPLLGGPWLPCWWCEGTGLMTPHTRGEWLRFKKEEKRIHRIVLERLLKKRQKNGDTNKKH